MNTDTKKLARAAFAARMGQDKPKTLQASLIYFRFFLPIPACWDLLPCSRIARYAHPFRAAFGTLSCFAWLWLVFSNCDRELLIMKLLYVACIK
jgi:hypothetical protein